MLSSCYYDHSCWKGYFDTRLGNIASSETGSYKFTHNLHMRMLYPNFVQTLLGLPLLLLWFSTHKCTHKIFKFVQLSDYAAIFALFICVNFADSRGHQDQFHLQCSGWRLWPEVWKILVLRIIWMVTTSIC
jgi:hypothetical protein